MKPRYSVRVVFVVMAILALLAVAGAQGAATADKSISALDNVPRFQQTLAEAGFSTFEGPTAYLDAVKECCTGRIIDTLGNNPWPSSYLVPQQMTPPTYPQPFLPWIWQLREDEAIVMVGQTPPPAAYFSYATFVAFLPGNPEKVSFPVGDGFNSLTIHTNGPDPFNRPIVYIITGHQDTARRVRAAALAAGYPASIINIETIAPAVAPLGIGPQGSLMYMLHRVTIAEDAAAVENYIKNPPYKVFRVTPNPVGAEPVFEANAFAAPVLRVRGTGHTEMDLYPALKRLRQAILDEYDDMPYRDLDTHIFGDNVRRFGEKPYVGMQRGLDVMGATRDANYLATQPPFALREGVDEFAIVYGVDHAATGKATYSSFAVYADTFRMFGLKTVYSPDFGDSARRYLPDDPDADMLYAWKVARDCAEDEPYCLEVTQPEFIDIDGNSYDCTPPVNLNNEEIWMAFRAYLEPATKTGPDDNELLYDQVIYFGPYFNEP